MAIDRSPSTFDSTDPQKILTLGGMALYQAQLLEFSVSNLAIGLYASRKSDVTRSEIVDMFASLERDTLGRVLKEVREHVTVDIAADKQMVALLTKRNCLIHGFFRAHDADFTDLRGRKIMADELHAMADGFHHGHMALEGMYLPLWASLGVTDAVMQPVRDEMMQQAEQRWSQDGVTTDHER